MLYKIWAKLKKLKDKSHECGQSTIEFALTLILLFSFTLFFFQLSLVFAYGNYVQYATFMAARAYLSAGGSEQDQSDRALSSIVRMLKVSEDQPSKDKFSMIARGVGGNPAGVLIGRGAQYSDSQKPDRNFSWQEGVRYTFRSSLFWIPIGGSASSSEVTLTSESWLGREPAASECKRDMPQGGVFDNGC